MNEEDQQTADEVVDGHKQVRVGKFVCLTRTTGKSSKKERKTKSGEGGGQGTDIPFEGKGAEFQTPTCVDHWLALAQIVYSFVGICWARGETYHFMMAQSVGYGCILYAQVVVKKKGHQSEISLLKFFGVAYHLHQCHGAICH